MVWTTARPPSVVCRNLPTMYLCAPKAVCGMWFFRTMQRRAGRSMWNEASCMHYGADLRRRAAPWICFWSAA